LHSKLSCPHAHFGSLHIKLRYIEHQETLKLGGKF
jgi:hypothetical protein